MKIDLNISEEFKECKVTISIVFSIEKWMPNNLFGIIGFVVMFVLIYVFI